MSNKKKTRAIVASGGGAFGAWGGGTIEGLINKNGGDYDVCIGSSTGILLSPLTATKEMARLKEAYTSVTQESIFNINPFTKKGGINVFNALYRVLILNPICKLFKGENRPTLGESENLRKTIKGLFTEQDYIKIREELGKELVAVVVNLKTGLSEYKSSNEYSYEDFVDWMWASSNVPIWMSLLKKEGSEFVDGGIIEHIPIQGAIDRGVDEIDVIVHRPAKYAAKDNFFAKNVLQLFMRVSGIMHKEISKDDISIGRLKAKDKDVKINVYYTPYMLAENSLMFDKKVMEDWWNLGMKGIEDGTCEKRSIVLVNEKVEKGNNEGCK